jgi:tetratricopeptide (TPR) repeat protein
VWTLPTLLIAPSGFVNGPGSYGSLLEIVATFVNLHHFVLDGAIWKLRNSRIASVLIRSAPEADAAVAPRSPWLRRAVWGTAAAGLLAGLAGFGLINFYVPAALARGDLDRAERGVALSRWVGSDLPAVHEQLVMRFQRSGDLARADAHVERLVALRADGKTYALLGDVRAAQGRPDEARAAYETAVEKGAPHLSQVHVALARLALERGEDAAAAEHYHAAITLQPSSKRIANDLAWLLATSSDPNVRNAEVATAAAEALAKVEESTPHLDTLAAAYAAGGRFDDAVRTASRAAELAEREHDATRLSDIRRNLDRYRARLTAAR